MKLKGPGKNTSAIEVLNISKRGLWLLAAGKEYFLPYTDYPWFRGQTVEEIHNVRLLHGLHLRWDDLDVDLELRSLKQPALYPLKYR